MLLARPYFERTWIRQEVLFVTCAFVQCGQKRLAWSDFRKAVACLRWKGWSSNATTTGDMFNLVDNAFPLVQIPDFAFRLSDIRSVLRGTKCDDDRDRLYAVLSLLCTEDKELRITPNYAHTVQELYIDLTRRTIIQQHHLKLLVSCELATKVLDIPSWVPDWSSRTSIGSILYSNWSACAWISAQAKISDDKTTRVTGVKAACVEQVTEYELHKYRNIEDPLRVLRALTPSGYTQIGQKTPDPHQGARYCQCLAGYFFRDDYLPPRDEVLDLPKTMRNIESMWSSNVTWNELFPEGDTNTEAFVARCRYGLEGRCFVTASNGFIGHAPAGTRRGDLICVLLGCRFPVADLSTINPINPETLDWIDWVVTRLRIDWID
jgi:hypothetical protein